MFTALSSEFADMEQFADHVQAFDRDIMSKVKVLWSIAEILAWGR